MHQNQYCSPFLQSSEYRFHQPWTKRKVRRVLQSLKNHILLSPAQLCDSENYGEIWVSFVSGFEGEPAVKLGLTKGGEKNESVRT